MRQLHKSGKWSELGKGWTGLHRLHRDAMAQGPSKGFLSDPFPRAQLSRRGRRGCFGEICKSQQIEDSSLCASPARQRICSSVPCFSALLHLSQEACSTISSCFHRFRTGQPLAPVAYGTRPCSGQAGNKISTPLWIYVRAWIRAVSSPMVHCAGPWSVELSWILHRFQLWQRTPHNFSSCYFSSTGTGCLVDYSATPLPPVSTSRLLAAQCRLPHTFAHSCLSL